MRSSTNPVTRRLVFYIPGYDPSHPRRYRELYRSEGAAQAAISGYALSLCAKSEKGPFGWQVTGRMEGLETRAQIEVLVWSDIVRASMDASIAGTYAAMIRTAWVYISTGALWRLMRLRKGPVLAALYPVAMLLLQAALALALAALTYTAAARLLALIPPSSLAGWPVLHGVAAAGAALAVLLRTLRWFRALDAKFFVYYLMHDYGFSAATRGVYPAPLEARMAEFAGRIGAALEADVDEVLVVGHSSGAHLAVSVLADVIRAGRVPPRGPALALLTLGQVVPMVSFLPGAERLRRDLHALSGSDALTWVDVTAPGDGCAFALCDPVAVSGVAPPGKRWPLVFSAAFSRSLSPERRKALRWRFFRLHFQYLCAFDRPRDYDYFAITSGPHTLAARYAHRPASKSRIEQAVNKFTSRAA